MNQQSQVNRSLLIMAYRGAREIMPENTLTAFQFALDTGADAIELDVHLSKDDELIVMHDPQVDRTTDSKGAIRDHTLAALKTLDAGANLAAGNSEQIHSEQIQRIPTLQEVYDLVQGRVQINIEIKSDANGNRYPGIEAAVIDLVRHNNATGYTVVSSFDFSILATLQTLAPDIPIYAIVARDYFQAVDPNDPDQVTADLAAKGFSWVAVNKGYLTQPLIDSLHDHNITVHTWVINDVVEMETFIDMDVDAITTDRPDLLVPAYRMRSLER